MLTTQMLTEKSLNFIVRTIQNLLNLISTWAFLALKVVQYMLTNMNLQ